MQISSHVSGVKVLSSAFMVYRASMNSSTGLLFWSILRNFLSTKIPTYVRKLAVL